MRTATRVLGLAALGAPLLVGNAYAAAYATGGSSIYRDQVLWLTWGDENNPNGKVGQTLDNSSKTRASIPVAAGQMMEVTCSLPDATGKGLFSYAPGDWSGDVLDDLYNIGGTGKSNQLISGIAREEGTSKFTVKCEATLGGKPYAIRGLVMADAESINTGVEYVEATARGTWTVVELQKNLSPGVGGYTARKTQAGANQTVLCGWPPHCKR